MISTPRGRRMEEEGPERKWKREQENEEATVKRGKQRKDEKIPDQQTAKKAQDSKTETQDAETPRHD